MSADHWTDVDTVRPLHAACLVCDTEATFAGAVSPVLTWIPLVTVCLASNSQPLLLFCVMPVMHTGCGVMVQGFMCSHGLLKVAALL